MIRLAQLPSRERLQFGWFVAGASVVVAVLVWVLWVMPINRSIESASPSPLGAPIVHEARSGETIGIWATGASALLGTAECTVAGPHGEPTSVYSVRDLGWADTLWWYTARPGVEQIRWFTATSSGTYTVNCADSLDTYDGEYLLADSAGGGGSLGLGRGGGVTFSIAAALAVAAVGSPLLAVMLIPIMVIQTVRVRRRRSVDEPKPDRATN
ncbi:hypothetical protein [Arthrobacter sp. GMC3]|uniref:hypothetical protein n=1 Tax=Arthrobacter sp. GMC3 TaxID=2058894 RepID=UPI000CE3DBE2|nr:hypothetical protein [Arthrobacter sp. GMC3]